MPPDDTGLHYNCDCAHLLRIPHGTSTIRLVDSHARVPVAGACGAFRLCAQREIGNGVGDRHGERPGRGDRQDGRQAARHRRDSRRPAPLRERPAERLARGRGSRSAIKLIKVGERPRGIGFLPDGSRAYVAAENSDRVYVIDCARAEVIAVIAAGKRSNGIAVRPDGKVVFVSNGGDASVSAIDVASGKITATVPVGQRPWNMALTPDGKKLYVANGRSNSVSVIDAEAMTPLRDIPVGEAPWGVVVR